MVMSLDSLRHHIDRVIFFRGGSSAPLPFKKHSGAIAVDDVPNRPMSVRVMWGADAAYVLVTASPSVLVLSWMAEPLHRFMVASVHLSVNAIF